MHDEAKPRGRFHADAMRVSALAVVALVSLSLFYPTHKATRALKSFDEDTLYQLLLVRDIRGGGVCFWYGPPEYDPRYVTLRRLDRLGLVILTPQQLTFDRCQNPHALTLTDSGRETRSFLLALVTTHLRSRAIASSAHLPDRARLLFDEDMVIQLLYTGLGSCPCFQGDPENDPRYSALKKLDRLNLVVFTPEARPGVCSSINTLRLTDSGMDTLAWLHAFLAAQAGDETVVPWSNNPSRPSQILDFGPIQS